MFWVANPFKKYDTKQKTIKFTIPKFITSQLPRDCNYATMTLNLRII